MLDDYSSTQDEKSKTTIFVNVLLQQDWMIAAANDEDPQLKIWEIETEDSVLTRNLSSKLHVTINHSKVMITILFLFENALFKA